MSKASTIVILALVLVAMCLSPVYAETLKGAIGSSSRWGSGWIDLKPSVDFQKGEKLKLTIEGSAKKIVIRLLTEGDDPNDPVGVLGVFAVPQNRVIEVVLPENRNRVKQISVHGKKPWDYDVPANNGPATLKAVERVR